MPSAPPTPPTPTHTEAKKIRHLFFSHIQEVGRCRIPGQIWQLTSSGIQSCLCCFAICSISQVQNGCLRSSVYISIPESRKKEGRRPSHFSKDTCKRYRTTCLFTSGQPGFSLRIPSCKGSWGSCLSAGQRCVQFKIKVCTSKEKRENGYWGKQGLVTNFELKKGMISYFWENLTCAIKSECILSVYQSGNLDYMPSWAPPLL